LLDKIFFMDKIDATAIVDYGCADGTLIHFLHSLFPEYQYIGYDIDEDMLEQARSKFSEEELASEVMFTNDLSLDRWINGQDAAIILSSVIHEVYAYGTRADVDAVWREVYSGKYKYVIVRDMIPSGSIDKKSDINDVRAIMRKADAGQLREFEQVWGSIEQNKNLVHFLLKYRYKENWNREVRENYFPLTREEFISSIPDEYEIEFHEHFVLPFLKNVVRKDYGITLKDNTHFKMILKRLD